MGLVEKQNLNALVSSRKLIGEIFVEMKLLSAEEAVQATARAHAKKMRLGELLVHEKKVTEHQLARALATQYGLEFLELDESFVPSPEALKLLPEKIATQNLILPLSIKDGVLTLAVYDPVEFVKLDSFRKTLKLTCVLKVVVRQALERAIANSYVHGESVESIIENLAETLVQAKTIESPKPKALAIVVGAEESSVEALVHKVIDHAIREEASDIHLDPAEKRVRVRFRIDGILHEIYTYPLEVHPTIASVLKVRAELDISEKRNPQDGRFNYVTKLRRVDIRVSTLPTIWGEKLVLRILDRDQLKTKLTDIGISPKMSDEALRLLHGPYGIIFITGPTGSGKTTTLYTMLHQLNATEMNIVTVEDPVEMRFEIINQVQVNEKAGLTFANILRNILRQDPDVLLIGEVRDRETADIAVRSALTGHLVLSTLHTNDAVSAPSRLIDIGVEPFLLSSALNAVISQRLIRLLCVHCRVKTALTEKQHHALGPKAMAVGSPVYAAVGCKHCHSSGYRHRTPIFEILVVDNTIRKMIAAKKTEVEVTAYLHTQGFVSMREDGIQKIAAGLTSVEEVLKNTF